MYVCSTAQYMQAISCSKLTEHAGEAQRDECGWALLRQLAICFLRLFMLWEVDGSE